MDPLISVIGINLVVNYALVTGKHKEQYKAITLALYTRYQLRHIIQWLTWIPRQGVT
ncbi:hypothetical protein [Psychromonas sp. L1A2]|uniref:hypothetical protein n=1 Tax=Psychromonas sp. L1A2 TaxID=2686356 RepID=UPI0013593BCC|nr:hypothetical protein [Psychromonas sp. L1A2]